MTTVERLNDWHRKIADGKIKSIEIDEINALGEAIKALEDQPKYEAALKLMAAENIPDNSYQFCFACINEDPTRSPYEGRVCQRHEGRKGVIYTNECGRAAIVYYKNKVGLDGGTNV
jgi:hypothetical protein